MAQKELSFEEQFEILKAMVLLHNETLKEHNKAILEHNAILESGIRIVKELKERMEDLTGIPVTGEGHE